jgi:hypothetical protein
MQTKGVVMQVAEGFAVVMTKNCEFRKIPLIEGMAMGQEVDIPSETIVPLPKKARTWYKNSWMKTGMVAASMLLAVGLWTGQSLFSDPKAYAYVSVDINPSIELSIDQNKKVVSVTPLNSDGEKVLSEVSLTGLSVEQAVAKLAEIARSQGYLHDKSEVIITASPAIEEDKLVKHNMNLEQLESQLVNQVKTLATTYGTEVDVEGIRVSDDVRTAAHDAGVSPGKYALYLAALSNGIDVDINELKTQPISKIVDQRGTQLAEVLHDLKGGEQLDGLLKQYKNDGKQGLNSKPAVIPNNKVPERDDKPIPPGPAKKDDKPKGDDKSNNGNGNNTSSQNKGQPAGNENSSGHVGNGNLNWNGNANANGTSNGNKGNPQKSDDKGSDHRGDDKNGNWSWHLNLNLNGNAPDKNDVRNDHKNNDKNDHKNNDNGKDDHNKKGRD